MQLALLFSFLPSSFLEGMMSGAAVAFLQPWGETHQLKAPQMADSGSNVLECWQCQQSTTSKLLMGVCVCVCVCVCVQSLSYAWLFVTPWTVAHQFLCSWSFPGKNFPGNWCGLPFPNYRGSSLLRDQTCISSASCIGRHIRYLCTTWEALRMGESHLIKVIVKINK